MDTKQSIAPLGATTTHAEASVANTNRPILTPQEILQRLKERKRNAPPPEPMTREAIEAAKQRMENFARYQRDHRAVIAGTETEERVSFDYRLSILNEQFEILMMEIEGSRDDIRFAEGLLANPEARGAGSPENLDRVIAEARAHIAEVRVEILRVTDLIIDTLAGKFGDRTPQEEAARSVDRQCCGD